MGVVIWLQSGCCLVRFRCLNLSPSGIDYDMHRELVGLLRVYYIYGLCVSFILFIVLWDITQTAFFQVLAYKEPPCDGVEAQYVS